MNNKMTNEKALEVLKDTFATFYSSDKYTQEETCGAYDMAVKALEREPGYKKKISELYQELSDIYRRLTEEYNSLYRHM